MSWKRYGGIKQLDTFNHINVNSIITDDFVMREAYNGTFTISGDLFVVEDCSFNGKVEIGHNAIVHDSMYVKNRIYIGNDQEFEPIRFLDSTSNGIGIDVTNPKALFDISGSNNHIIHVFSNQESAKSTLVQNVHNNKAVLSIDNSFGTLLYEFNDSSGALVYDFSQNRFTTTQSFSVDNDLLVSNMMMLLYMVT
jgi:hypothetical protein